MADFRPHHPGRRDRGENRGGDGGRYSRRRRENFPDTADFGDASGRSARCRNSPTLSTGWPHERGARRSSSTRRKICCSAAKAAGADVAETCDERGHVDFAAAPARQNRGNRARRRPRARACGCSSGKQNASISAGSIDPAAFARLAEQAVAMARVVPEDLYAEIPDAPPPIDAAFLDLDDPVEPSMEVLIGRAAAAEDAAMAVPGITNSEGASASWGRSTSRAGDQPRALPGTTPAPITASPPPRLPAPARICSATMIIPPPCMARIWTTRRHSANAPPTQALARLNPARPKTAKLPVIFDPRVSNSVSWAFVRRHQRRRRRARHVVSER